MTCTAAFLKPRRTGFLVSLLLLSALAAPADAQRKTGSTTPRRAQAWEGLSVPTKAAITVNGRTYKTSVNTQCEFDERATPGSSRWQWMVLYPPIGLARKSSESVSDFSLTLWRPTSGGPIRFTYSATVDGNSSLVQTFGDPVGSGTASVTRVGNGAKFVVSGRNASGAAVSATIECSLVRKPEAQGG